MINKRHLFYWLAAFLAVAIALGARAVARAQTSSQQVTVTSSTFTPAPSAGTNNAAISTFTVTAPGTVPYTFSSVSLTLTAGSGGSASNLSNCHIVNSNGTTLNTGTHNVATVVSGTNTFTFDQPLTINGGTSQTFTVRCDVAAATPTGSTFSFTAGTPLFAPNLRASVVASPSIPQGKSGAVIALITFDAMRSGSNVNVSSIPITLTPGGLPSNAFTNCTIRSVSNLGASLNTGGNAVSSINTGGATTFNLNTPTTVSAGTSAIYALVCDISPSAAVGGTFNVSLAPSGVLASTPNGSSITPTSIIGPSGASLPTGGLATIVAAGGGTVTVPGAPNTGHGTAILNTIFAAFAAGLLLTALALSISLRRNP